MRGTRVVRGGTLAGLAAALVIAAACGEAERRAVRGGTVVLVQAGAPAAANPLTAADSYSQQMNLHLLFLPLLRLDADLEPGPGLAESWSSEGDSVVVLRLRRDVRWSDGRPTTAHDVAFTLDRALDPATGYPGRGAIGHLRSVEAVDSFTVRIGLEPVREPLTALALLPVLPAHALDSVAPERLRNAAFNRAPVTNGPFTVAEARPGERWVFTRNDGFPGGPGGLGGPPRLDRLVWRAVPESDAQLVELRAGEADLVAGARADGYDRTRQLDGVRGVERPMLSYTGIAWNGRRPPLDDPRVRRALTLAIDRQRILDGLRGGHGEVADGPIPSRHWAAAPGEPLPHDPASARLLLDEAGLVDRDGDGLRDRPDGARLRLELLIPAGSDFNRDVAQAVQSDLSGVGVDLALRQLEFGTLIQTITGADRAFDAVLIALDADPRLDLRGLFHSGTMSGPFQVAGYADARMDSLLDALEATRDGDRAAALLRDVTELVRRDQPWTYLYYLTELILVRDRLQGVEADLRGLLHSAPGWWVDAPATADTAALDA